MPEIENAIIGGGPAGSALAILLARQGREVCLLERKRSAHHKVCGEFISWEAADYLEALGIDLSALGALSIRRLRLVRGEQVLEAALPFTAWSLSRRSLDNKLLELAQHSGAEVRLGSAVRSLAHGENGWQLRLQDGRSLYAGQCFLASGKYDLPGWRRPKPENEMIGLKMHLRLRTAAREKLDEVVEVHVFDGGYAGLEAVEKDHANLCLLIDTAVFKACQQDWPRMLDWLAGRSSHMEEQLSAAISVWPRPLAVGGIPYGHLHGYGRGDQCDGLYRLGDQLAVIHSFTGDGIAIALHSAFLAARCQEAGLDARSFHQQAAQQLQSPVRNAQALSRVLDSAAGRALIVPLGRHFPVLVQQAISRTRLRGLVSRGRPHSVD